MPLGLRALSETGGHDWKANAAILFEPSAFDAQTKKIMGRNVAGATFLDAFVRSAEVDRYVGVASASDGRGQFRERVAGLTAVIRCDRCGPSTC